ncbi:hypothetical protein L5D95_11000, partial [Streptococcus pneumoniae]|nr:hypothetical protein [Streptococcus pneumoniae]
TVGMLRTSNKPRILARTVAYICQYNKINFFILVQKMLILEIKKSTHKFLNTENGLEKLLIIQI